MRDENNCWSFDPRDTVDRTLSMLEHRVNRRNIPAVGIA
jgi:hypothetical protein